MTSFFVQSAELYNSVLRTQFDLSYHTHMSWADTESMPTAERLRYYYMLIDQKQAEQREMDKAQKQKK